jgi:hypothetical protein
MSTDKTYNGWTNYETWAVKLWMDNDEGEYNFWQEATREAWDNPADNRFIPSRKDRAIIALADRLKDVHEENQPEVTGVFADLLNAAMSEVDWREIAESLFSDFEPSAEVVAEDEGDA